MRPLFSSTRIRNKSTFVWVYSFCAVDDGSLRGAAEPGAAEPGAAAELGRAELGAAAVLPTVAGVEGGAGKGFAAQFCQTSINRNINGAENSNFMPGFQMRDLFFGVDR